MDSSCCGSLSREDYARAERFLPGNQSKLVFRDAVKPNWIGPRDRFWYKVDTRDGKEFVFVDPVADTPVPLFDHARLAAALSAASGNPCEPLQLPFDAIEWFEEGKRIGFTVGKVYWTCDMDVYRLTQEEAKAAIPHELPSPDGRYAAFVRGDNLFMRVIATGEEVALTTDGAPCDNYATSTDSNGSSVTILRAGVQPPPVAIWSPDSKRLVTHRLDQREVLPLHLLQSVPPTGQRPVLHTYRYSMPGDKNVPLAQLFVFDVEARVPTKVQLEPEQATNLTPIEFKAVWWGVKGDKAYSLWTERGHRCLRLYEIDAVTGAARLITEERGQTLVESNLVWLSYPNVRIVGDGAEVIWCSQRDGWAHLYLYDGQTGELKNQITSGPWRVRDILGVDEQKRRVWFTAGGREPGRDPLYRHLYAVNLDGTEMALLTPEDADHEVVISPSGAHFVDTFSRVDLAPVTVLRTADGALVRTLEQADVECLLATGWRWPERFEVKADDGVTSLYGNIYRPADLDPARTYPVLDSVYPGPQHGRAQPRFGLDVSGQADAIAQLGFIVVTIDGRGTPSRSKAFQDFQYGNLQAAGGLEDHVAGLRQLATRYPYMDLSRVGVYGHSGGGYASTRAVLAFPDFYKVAVSSAGNHDSRGYLAAWGERYIGLPEGDNYLAQANAPLAGNLKGKLLIICGDMDDNVHPALTFQVVDALIKANKDFDMLVLPNRSHSYGLDGYHVRRRWDYFVRHLLGKEPPTGVGVKVTASGPK